MGRYTYLDDAVWHHGLLEHLDDPGVLPCELGEPRREELRVSVRAGGVVTPQVPLQGDVAGTLQGQDEIDVAKLFSSYVWLVRDGSSGPPGCMCLCRRNLVCMCGK